MKCFGISWALPEYERHRQQCRDIVQRIAARERCWLLSIADEGVGVHEMWTHWARDCLQMSADTQ